MLIKKMLDLYSPTGYEERLVRFLIKWANEKGFNAYQDEVGNFIAERGKGAGGILLVGHVDTVPGIIPVRMEDNILYGRGAVDAKGPLACFLESARSVSVGRIVVVGVVDEEGESKGARNILNKFSPDYVIVGEPSGWSNLNIGYKGRLSLYYANENGKEHSSTSNLNCYEQAIEFYSNLRNYCDNFNSGKKLFDQLGVKLTSIHTNSDDFIERIKMHINFRIPVGFEIRDIKNFVEETKSSAKVVFSGFEEAVKVSKNNELISAFIRSIREAEGEPRFKCKTGTADMNILQKFEVPIVTYGPGDSSLDHTPNEYLDLNEYKKSVNILKSVLEKIINREF